MIQLSQNFKRYVHNTGYLFFEKIIRALVTVAVWALVIRYLGPQQFGLLSYALSFVFLFSILSDLSIDAIVVRDLIKNYQLRYEILGTTFFLKLIGGILAVALISIVTHTRLFNEQTRLLIMVMSMRLIFQSLNNIDYFFQSRVLSKYTVYSQLLSLVSTAVLCLLFIKFKMPVVYFVYTVVIEAAIVSLCLVIFYTRAQERITQWKISWPMVRKLIADAWPLVIAGVAVSIYMRVDQIMIKEMLGTVAVGYYSAAVRISEVCYFIPIVLANSLFPAIVNAKLKDESLYQDRLQALFSILLWIAIGISFVMTIAAYPLVSVLYGPMYSPAAGVLAIHAWASVFVFWGVARSKWAINENLQIYMMIYVIVAAAVNIILNVALIPVFHINGAAIAAVFSQFVAAALSNLFNRRTRPLFFVQLNSFDLIRVLKKVNFTG